MYVSGCRIQYSLTRSDGSVATTSYSTGTPTVAPNSYGYGQLWLAQDSQMGPSGSWSEVRLDKADCSISRNDVFEYSAGSPLVYTFGADVLKGSWIYSNIAITNSGDRMVRAFANIAIISPNYNIVGASGLSGPDGCAIIAIPAKSTIDCQIVREQVAPFGQYLITWTTYRYANDPIPVLSPVIISLTQSQQASPRRVCVTSKVLSKTCFDQPKWTYEICSSDQSGRLQEKSGSKWINRQNFKGLRDANSCPSDSPFLVTVTRKTQMKSGSVHFRLLFAKKGNSPSWTDTFTLSIG